MSRETEKKDYESHIFAIFLERSPLIIEAGSIRPGDHIKGEPDILCKSSIGEDLAFELARLTNSDLMAVQNSRNPENYAYVRTREYSPDVTRRKLAKQYQTSFPVHLLLYTEFPTASPESFILESVEHEIRKSSHSYKSIWFMGQSFRLLYERSPVGHVAAVAVT